MPNQKFVKAIPIVLVTLTDVPVNGGYMLTIRLHKDDKAIIDTACRAIGMSQGQFMRAMLVNGGKSILSELGLRAQIQEL